MKTKQAKDNLLPFLVSSSIFPSPLSLGIKAVAKLKKYKIVFPPLAALLPLPLSPHS